MPYSRKVSRLCNNTSGNIVGRYTDKNISDKANNIYLTMGLCRELGLAGKGACRHDRTKLNII